MRADAADRLVRADIAQYLAGPAFGWFLDRPGARRGDKAAPIALLPEAVRLRLGATAPVLEMTDRVAGIQRRRHGDIPAAGYAGIQQLVDDVAPERRRREWVWEADGWRLAVRVRNGVARVAEYRRGD